MTKTGYIRRLTRWLSALALGAACQIACATPAWQINPSGQGIGGATTVAAIDVAGVGFVQIIPTGLTTFSFIEHGAYQLLQPDGSPFGAQDLTVTYTVAGTGNFYDPFALHFTSGSIGLYVDSLFDFATAAGSYGADNGTPLGSFSVFDGGLDASGLFTLQARLDTGSLLAGYLFDADGRDMANGDNVILQLGVYNQTTTPDDLQIAEIICGMAGYTGPGCNGGTFANSAFAYAVRDGGSVSLSSVPEPASIALLLAGLALIPVAGRQRRSMAANK